MPLKPIFEKAPLKAAALLPLRPGQVRTADPVAVRLLELAGDPEDVTLWEGILRTAAAVEAHAEQTPTAKRVQAALAMQAEDGSLPLELPASLAVMRAAFALYEATAQRELAERIARWFGWLNTVWEDAIADRSIRQHPADLMELLEQLYRVGGKKAMLSLMEKLRRSGMDWSGLLHTFAVQRPMSKVTSWADLETGMKEENGHEDGFYTRQLLACHGESLADGARAARLNGVFSGNGQELSACKTGWERITRYHGAVCGGMTCDETVAGTSPEAGIDTAAIGAWCEALCGAAEETDALWAWDAIEKLAVNSIPHALLSGRAAELIRVNGLAADCGTAGAYHMSSNRGNRALSRLLRGYAAVLSHAVTARRDGFDLNMLMTGRYTVAMPEGIVTVSVTAERGKAVIRLHSAKSIACGIGLRIPAWMEEACVTVNSDGGDEGKPESMLRLSRTWQDGDTVTVEWKEKLYTADGHHQGIAVYEGGRLLCLPANRDGRWAVALTGAPVKAENGDVTCQAATVPGWRCRGSVPTDLPVLPRTEGEPVTIELKPYAESWGIALFPKGVRA